MVPGYAWSVNFCVQGHFSLYGPTLCLRRAISNSQTKVLLLQYEPWPRQLGSSKPGGHRWQLIFQAGIDAILSYCRLKVDEALPAMNACIHVR